MKQAYRMKDKGRGGMIRKKNGRANGMNRILRMMGEGNNQEEMDGRRDEEHCHP